MRRKSCNWVQYDVVLQPHFHKLFSVSLHKTSGNDVKGIPQFKAAKNNSSCPHFTDMMKPFKWTKTGKNSPTLSQTAFLIGQFALGICFVGNTSRFTLLASGGGLCHVYCVICQKGFNLGSALEVVAPAC